jgi:thiol:disulfide interchange protein DsbD
MKSSNNRYLQSTVLLWVLVAGSSAIAASLFEKLPWSEGSDQPRILPVDRAFQFSSYQVDRELKLSWFITPGHYLYSGRISLVTDQGAPISIEKPVGERYFDEYFGDVEIYRNNLELTVFLGESNSEASIPRQLEVRYQGCADQGYCYPPQKRPLELSQP